MLGRLAKANELVKMSSTLQGKLVGNWVGK